MIESCLRSEPDEEILERFGKSFSLAQLALSKGVNPERVAQAVAAVGGYKSGGAHLIVETVEKRFGLNQNIAGSDVEGCG